MSVLFAFLGMWLLSLVVAILASLQLGDFFRSGDEILLVLAAIAVFALVSIAVFAVGYARARSTEILNAVAFALALVASGLVLWPRTLGRIAERIANPHAAGMEKTYIALELLVPILLMVLVQWGLVRRRWLIVSGAQEVTRWPWVTTAVTSLAVLNPLGLTVIAAALAGPRSAPAWQFSATLTAAVAAALVVMAAIECYIRGRILRRRLEGSVV